MSEKIEFQGFAYDESILQKLGEEDLLKLRNIVASNLGVSSIKSFKDKDQAVSATWKALQKWNSEMNEEENVTEGDVKTKAPKAKAEPKEPVEVKAAKPKSVKRPTRGMFRRIEKLVDQPDRGSKRWENYQNGMTILDTIEGDNMTQLDVTFYVQNGYMKLIEPTEAEYEAELQAWYDKHGLENPAAEKARKAKEREQAKAAKAAEREAAKAKREQVKAAKAAEREQAKAAKAAEREEASAAETVSS